MRTYTVRQISFQLLFMFGCFFTTHAGDKPRLTGAELVAKHIDAIGGKEALSKFKSRVAVGTVKKGDEPDAKFAVMSEMPNRLAAVFVFRNFDWRLIYNSGKTYVLPQFPRQMAAIEHKYRDMLSSGLMYNGIALYNILVNVGKDDPKFEAKGTKKVNGRQTYVVEFKQQKAAPVRLYFDAETFMWVRTDYGRAQVTKEMGSFTNDVVNQGTGEATVDFYIETSDFREVDGIKLPFKFEQVVTAPILREKSAGTIVGTISEYRHNIAIEPSMFQ